MTLIDFCGFAGSVEGVPYHMEKLLTVNELAEVLNIAPGSVYHWISQNRLPVVRFSKRCVRFRESDVKELLDELAGRKNANTVSKNLR